MWHSLYLWPKVRDRLIQYCSCRSYVISWLPNLASWFILIGKWIRMNEQVAFQWPENCVEVYLHMKSFGLMMFGLEWCHCKKGAFQSNNVKKKRSDRSYLFLNNEENTTRDIWFRVAQSLDNLPLTKSINQNRTTKTAPPKRKGQCHIIHRHFVFGIQTGHRAILVLWSYSKNMNVYKRAVTFQAIILTGIW